MRVEMGVVLEENGYVNPRSLCQLVFAWFLLQDKMGEQSVFCLWCEKNAKGFQRDGPVFHWGVLLPTAPICHVVWAFIFPWYVIINLKNKYTLIFLIQGSCVTGFKTLHVASCWDRNAWSRWFSRQMAGEQKNKQNHAYTVSPPWLRTITLLYLPCLIGYSWSHCPVKYLWEYSHWEVV